MEAQVLHTLAHRQDRLCAYSIWTYSTNAENRCIRNTSVHYTGEYTSTAVYPSTATEVYGVVAYNTWASLVWNKARIVCCTSLMSLCTGALGPFHMEQNPLQSEGDLWVEQPCEGALKDGKLQKDNNIFSHKKIKKIKKWIKIYIINRIPGWDLKSPSSAYFLPG